MSLLSKQMQVCSHYQCKKNISSEMHRFNIAKIIDISPHTPYALEDIESRSGAAMILLCVKAVASKL